MNFTKTLREFVKYVKYFPNKFFTEKKLFGQPTVEHL